MLLENADFATLAALFRGRHFRNPPLLEVNKTPISRILLTGSCLLSSMEPYFGTALDYVLFNGGVIEQLPRPLSEYDFQICQIPLRFVLDDDAALWNTAWTDHRNHERLFRRTTERLKQFVERALRHNDDGSVPCFFVNFLVPTLNPNGRLLPSHTLGNIQYFVSQLNRELEIICGDMRNAFVVNADQIANSIGKMYFTDEFLFFFSHGSVFYLITDGEGARMEPTPATFEHYHLLNPSIFFEALVAEILAMYRSLRGVDAIKMVVIDLDDTLWKGVIGDQALDPESEDAFALKSRLNDMLEGWPLGIVEALMYLKRRGIILGVISRNDEDTIRTLFPLMFQGKMSLDDFAVKYINFNDKPDNMEALLQSVNLLSESVLYIDDNPVEREKISQRFPQMRVIGKYFQWTRHLLLNAPELQLPFISKESELRSFSIAGQAARTQPGAAASDRDFLQGLGLRIGSFELTAGSSEDKINRCIELVNKTNQWNSTGEKLDFARFRRFLAENGRIFGFAVADRLSHYGDVCFLLLRDGRVEQFIMSCRVAGLGVEASVLARMMAELGGDSLTLDFVPTGKNLPFKAFAERFPAEGSDYRVALRDLPDTSYIATV